MPKPTIQQRLCEGLLACGEGPEVEGKTSKARVIKKKSGGFWFVGRAGSLRYGQCYSKSFPASDGYKDRILRGVMLTAKFTAPLAVYYFYSDGSITLREKFEHGGMMLWGPSQSVRPTGGELLDGEPLKTAHDFQRWYEFTMLGNYRKVSL